MAQSGFAPRFNAGAVLSTGFSVTLEHFFPLFGLLFVAWLPVLAIALGMGLLGALAMALFAVVLGIEVIGEAFAVGMGLCAWVVLMLGTFVVKGTLVHAVLQILRDTPATLAENMRAGYARALDLGVLGLVVGVATSIGLLACVVPGLMLLTLWFVAIPCCVWEGQGPIESLQRSLDLTAGNRWQVFGVMIVIGIIDTVVSQGAGVLPAIAGDVGTAVMVVLLLLWLPVWSLLKTVCHAVAYRDLWAEKEGFAVEEPEVGEDYAYPVEE